jgi:hypothetical protein
MNEVEHWQILEGGFLKAFVAGVLMSINNGFRIR